MGKREMGREEECNDVRKRGKKWRVSVRRVPFAEIRAIATWNVEFGAECVQTRRGTRKKIGAVWFRTGLLKLTSPLYLSKCFNDPGYELRIRIETIC